MIRVSSSLPEPGSAILSVSGTIAGSEVAVLETELLRCTGQVRDVILDLAGVESIDADGLALLRRFRGPGLTLRARSAYVRALLRDEGIPVQ